MTVCLGNYATGTQIGTAGGPGAAATSLPVAYFTSGSCAGGEVELYTKSEVDALSSSSSSTTPTVVTCAGACTITHEVKVDLPIANLSLQEGGQIAGAILVVWAAGFIFRVISQAFSGDGKSSTSESES